MGTCEEQSSSSTPTSLNRALIDLILAQGPHPHAETGMGPLVEVKGNLKTPAYKDIRSSCVLPTLWQQFEEEQHMGMMVM